MKQPLAWDRNLDGAAKRLGFNDGLAFYEFVLELHDRLDQIEARIHRLELEQKRRVSEKQTDT